MRREHATAGAPAGLRTTRPRYAGRARPVVDQALFDQGQGLEAIIPPASGGSPFAFRSAQGLHVDAGYFVIVINAADVRLTGRKLEDKTYYRHTGYPCGVRSMTAQDMLAKHPERVIRKAVEGMLPRNRLGRRLAGKLKVYAGSEHPHAAQQPEPLSLKG